MPSSFGFCTVPLRLPDGKLFAAGAWHPSRDITLISCDEEPAFERIGNIPGERRYQVSTVLLADRFVVGCGGFSETPLDDLWIFDLRGHRGSPVTKRGEWHRADCFIPLVAQNNSLYLVGGEETTSIHSISLQTFSELIQDADIQEALQTALGLELRRYPVNEHEGDESQGERTLGRGFLGYRSYNTVDQQGRVLHFLSIQGKLCITEIFFGAWLKTRMVNTGANCKTDDDRHISCCSFGDKVLVMAGEENTTDVFCGLVSIDRGDLTRDSIHLEEKHIAGWENYRPAPFLAQISESKIWASFPGSNGIWIGELKGNELVMTKHPDHLPIAGGFGAPPLPLSDGRFLEAGGRPSSTDITLITPGEQFFFEKIGDMPGFGRWFVSTILLGSRFVVGFGGSGGRDCIAAMWIFDLRTRKVCSVKEKEEGFPAACLPVLVARNQEICFIGGNWTIPARSIPFTSFSRMIRHSDMRSAFCLCLHLPLRLHNDMRGRTSSFPMLHCL